MSWVECYTPECDPINNIMIYIEKDPKFNSLATGKRYVVRCPVQDVHKTRWEIVLVLGEDVNITDIDIFNEYLVLELKINAVTEALRQVAEGKASTKVEASEWKRKYEIESSRYMNLENIGVVCRVLGEKKKEVDVKPVLEPEKTTEAAFVKPPKAEECDEGEDEEGGLKGVL
ncbi:hypothetical protein POM88_009268 [Heracleum sosnowskyi]|uniref:Uncharacterized protein n=1 Tax=Heracleum sosnowskyi TaxID=360622 RepID=A0AAD8N2J1_9APIA|nr:hypothetical protein POM88_009268 [Heracleum sosnowskyi]